MFVNIYVICTYRWYTNMSVFFHGYECTSSGDTKDE